MRPSVHLCRSGVLAHVIERFADRTPTGNAVRELQMIITAG